MARSNPAPGASILRAWRLLSPIPGGRWLFSRVLGWVAPYSGTVGARFQELEPGRALVTLRDRRAVRNHLNSIHAIALANLGEIATGVAVLTALPAGTRGIVTGLSIEYVKKARGRLTVDCRVTPPEVTETIETEVRAELLDPQQDVVARISVRWRLSPQSDQPSPEVATAADPSQGARR